MNDLEPLVERKPGRYLYCVGSGNQDAISIACVVGRATMSKSSDTMMDHVLSPRNGGVIEHPDLTGHAGTPGRGAFMILFLRLEEGCVVAAKYHTAGCGPMIACGSMLSELVLGKSIAECRELTAEDLIEALDGVPPDKLHCPALAIGGRGLWKVPSKGSGPVVDFPRRKSQARLKANSEKFGRTFGCARAKAPGCLPFAGCGERLPAR